MRAMVLLAAVVLAGCAARLEAANERGGIVDTFGASYASGLEIADAHCRRFGRAAEFTGNGPRVGDLVFRCV
jgi:hypothetical protein